MSAGIRIGIDLGGTKIEGAAFGAGGTEMARHRVPAPRGDYAASVAAIAELVRRLDRGAGQQGTVGIGMPGSLSPATGLVRNANSTWLNGQPLQRDLEARLERPVRLANDANCFALSEAVDGAAAGARLVFGVILGTGCGGGIVSDKRVVDGPLGVAGEWGHNPLPWTSAGEHPGPLCWCGRYGCMETWVSGPALAADHARATGAALSPEEVVAQAQNGGREAQATLDRHASRLARGLAAIVNVLDPDVIVLGGGLSQLAHLYEWLPGLMTPHIFSDQVSVRIKPPRWGDAGGVRGAAWLWPASPAPA